MTATLPVVSSTTAATDSQGGVAALPYLGQDVLARHALGPRFSSRKRDPS
jgi:hypothetical protein